ncbi:hypothetical protein HispidOSU_004637 [Sigmodon hispidus]
MKLQEGALLSRRVRQGREEAELRRPASVETPPRRAARSPRCSFPGRGDSKSLALSGCPA